MRGPFQVLLIPFRAASGGGIEYAAFREAASGDWRFPSGSRAGEESTTETARRLASVVLSLPAETDLFRLLSVGEDPATGLKEYAFGIDGLQHPLELPPGSVEMRWFPGNEVTALLHSPSARAALSELATQLGHSLRVA